MVNDILESNPKVKGFQIMAADGGFMFSSKAGDWLPDTQRFRQAAMLIMVKRNRGALVGVKF